MAAKSVLSFATSVSNAVTLSDDVVPAADAEVFYLKAMAWGGIPVFLCLFLGMTIGGMSCICHDKSAGIFYRLRIGNVMQKWHVAAVAVLYLLYPTLCTSSLDYI